MARKNSAAARVLGRSEKKEGREARARPGFGFEGAGAADQVVATPEGNGHATTAYGAVRRRPGARAVRG